MAHPTRLSVRTVLTSLASLTSHLGLAIVASSCTGSEMGAGSDGDTDTDTGSSSLPCQNDFDCKGDRICVDGFCTDPSEMGPACFELNGEIVCGQSMDPSPTAEEMLSGTVPPPVGEIPDSKSLNLTGFTIRSQGPMCGSCVPFAIRSAMGLRATIQANEFSDFSPAHIWSIAGYGSDNCVNGTSLSQVVALNQNSGEHVVHEPFWPYDPNSPFTSLDAIPNALVLEQNGVAQISSVVYVGAKSSLQIKYAIVQSWPPVISIPVYDEDWMDGDIDLPDEGATTMSHHAVTVVGYDDATNRFQFANSWGTNFGEEGFGTISYDFIDTYSGGGIALQQLIFNEDGAICGDGTCEGGESEDSCCLDCGCPGGSACETGSCVMGSSCGNGEASANEQCDGGDLKGQTCASLGFDSGSLGCKLDCTIDTSSCCSSECSDGTAQCVGDDSVAMCGQFDQDVCFELGSSQMCTQGQTCSSGQCGCGNGADDQFSIQAYVYPNFGPAGCSGDGTLKLKAAAEMVNATTLRIHVRKEDDTAFGSPSNLTLYVGDGPTCPNPPNQVKATKAVQVNAVDQTIDLTVNPYGAAWALNETKEFWVGKDEGGFDSFRATNVISVDRACIP